MQSVLLFLIFIMVASVNGAPAPDWNPNWMQEYPPYSKPAVPQPQHQAQSGNNNANPPTTHSRPLYCDEPHCDKVYRVPVSEN